MPMQCYCSETRGTRLLMASDHFEVLNSLDQLLAIRQEWQALWEKSEGAYFLDFDSCRQSWDLVHRPQNRTLQCAVLRHDARIVAILPLVTHRQALWTIAKPLGP